MTERRPRQRTRRPTPVVAPRPSILPGENQADYDVLLNGLLTELEPSTAYERSLVYSLANCEWDLIRTYSIRDNILRNEMQSIAIEIFSRMNPVPAYIRDVQEELGTFRDDSRPLGRALFDPNSSRHEEAVETLEAQGNTMPEILARAHMRRERAQATLFNHITVLERRREKLRCEFDDLKTRRMIQINDEPALQKE